MVGAPSKISPATSTTSALESERRLIDTYVPRKGKVADLGENRRDISTYLTETFPRLEVLAVDANSITIAQRQKFNDQFRPVRQDAIRFLQFTYDASLDMIVMFGNNFGKLLEESDRAAFFQNSYRVLKNRRHLLFDAIYDKAVVTEDDTTGISRMDEGLVMVSFENVNKHTKKSKLFYPNEEYIASALKKSGLRLVDKCDLADGKSRRSYLVARR